MYSWHNNEKNQIRGQLATYTTAPKLHSLVIFQFSIKCSIETD